MVLEGLSSEVLAAIAGAGGLGAILTLVKIVNVALKTLNDRRADQRGAVLIDLESRKVMDEATRAGVETMGQMVVTLRGELTQVLKEHAEDRLHFRTFRGLVLQMIGEITTIIADAPTDIRKRIEAVHERFKEDADAS